MQKGRYRVSIVIPNFNRTRDLERLLPSIADQTFADYEVTIIDDHSPDKSAVEYIREFITDHKNIHLVENTENIGFVKTCNRGIKLATSDYICILTNDTEVTRDFVERNVKIMDADASIGVLSCIIVDQYGNNWFSGGSLKTGIPSMLREDFEGVRQVDYVAGTACFYRREVFDKIGLLNECFVMYHEDVEFCWRVRSKTNYRTCLFGEKLVTHYTGSPSIASNQVVYYLHRNYILLLRKYSPKSIPGALRFYLREIANLAVISVVKLSPGSFMSMLYIMRGTVAGLTEKIKV
jgi:GT2 family glycosyltransferase